MARECTLRYQPSVSSFKVENLGVRSMNFRVSTLKKTIIVVVCSFCLKNSFKGFMPQVRDDQGIGINGFPTIRSGVIPFTDGDNITLTARGYVSKTLEVEQTTMYLFHNGVNFSSSLLPVEHVLSLKNDYVSQKFALSSGDFSDSGVYEVQLIVDAYNGYYHHVQCRPYYDNFIRSSNRFGREEIVLSQAEVQLLYVG